MPANASAGWKQPNPDSKYAAAIPVGGVAGLYIQITPTGTRSFMLRYSRGGGKRAEMGLGSYPTVSLVDARRIAAETKVAIMQGADPVADRKAAKRETAAAQRTAGFTFTVALNEYYAAKHDELSRERYRKQWKANVEKYAVPVIGKLHVAEVT